MNNYGRNQMNNRTRQGNMQYRNQMNRNNCGCVETRTGNDNCGCNASVGCVDNRNDNRRANDNCGCNEARIEARINNDSCGCDHHHDHHTNSGIDRSGTAGCNASRYDQLSGMALAMSYVPWHTFCQMHDVEEALCHGTIFKELELVFMRGCRS